MKSNIRNRRAAIYCRISKHNDRVPKVEEQEALCRKTAKAAGYDVVVVYVDDGISASKGLNRPGWNQMLADAQAGKFDVLMAQSDDRFTRQTMEKEMLALTCVSAAVDWHTVNEGLINPSTAEGGLRSGLSTLLANYETRRKSERQRQANDAVRAKGRPLAGGDRPFGYEADKVNRRPAEANLVRQAYIDYLSGEKTLSRIRTDWNNDGVLTTRGKPWDIAKVEKVLRRPRNIRRVVSRGELLKRDDGRFVIGQWKSLIDIKTYNAVQAKLDSPSRRLTRQHVPKWLMSGLATCGACGGPMRGFQRTKESAYRCAVHDGQGIKEEGVRHVSIVTHDLDAPVVESVVSAVMLSPEGAVPDPDIKVLRNAYQRLSKISEQRARLLDLMEDDEDVADIRTKRRDLKAEADDLQQTILDVQARNARAALITDAQHALWSRQRRTADFMAGASIFEEAAEVKAGLRARFAALSLDQRRSLVAALLTVTVENGRGRGRVKIVHKVAHDLSAENHDGLNERSALQPAASAS
ncbi:recombinase family protein [Aeromicrobium fastidiosum]|uniref:Recombinase family protein n=1 Tax=Aeromicrobium fastidiosum TaxID=52699 RepID=A0A641AJF4_9ACTN|nr:recombinase family protein [Aeromicrobium fastidiosum]KAA1375971.1 recombinase family protein [Aeromicrobium fastidiosum]MBP2392169.1 DNA invertase Pin-like site-specific DNA recombinase [Aeromicrobium fastidiosum]